MAEFISLHVVAKIAGVAECEGVALSTSSRAGSSNSSQVLEESEERRAPLGSIVERPEVSSLVAGEAEAATVTSVAVVGTSLHVLVALF